MTLATAVCMLLAGDTPDKLGPINPNRPSFTDATQISILGHPSLEFGLRQMQFGRSTLTDFGDSATLFMALRDNFELHVGIPSYLAIHGAGASATGIGDQDMGFNWRFTPDPSGRKWGFAVEG